MGYQVNMNSVGGNTSLNINTDFGLGTGNYNNNNYNLNNYNNNNYNWDKYNPSNLTTAQNNYTPPPSQQGKSSFDWAALGSGLLQATASIINARASTKAADKQLDFMRQQYKDSKDEAEAAEKEEEEKKTKIKNQYKGMKTNLFSDETGEGINSNSLLGY
ncbi:MAG: hypothetical protein LBH46_01380 [Rickettsiales bacterium]|jgi:hypothetical protein|nr:hypothetical protein [Rickettsiales bacterium]